MFKVSGEYDTVMVSVDAAVPLTEWDGRPNLKELIQNLTRLYFWLSVERNEQGEEALAGSIKRVNSHLRWIQVARDQDEKHGSANHSTNRAILRTYGLLTTKDKVLMDHLYDRELVDLQAEMLMRASEDQK